MFSFLKKKNNADTKLLCAFAQGRVIPLTEVPDPVFAEKMIGDGIAIIVEGDTIYAPCPATVTMVAETKHAIALTCPSGTELLIHIGLETVNLKGRGFTPFVKANDKVKQGQPLMRIDLAFMKEQGLTLYTPLVILNKEDHPFQDVHEKAQVALGDPLLRLL